jgi:CRP-like cAMP-binding protein
MGFFSSLPRSIQIQMKEIGVEKFLGANEILIRKGDSDQKLYLLENGELNVQINGEIHSAFPGDVVGEIAFLDNRPRTATVTAKTPSTVLSFER